MNSGLKFPMKEKCVCESLNKTHIKGSLFNYERKEC